MKFIRVSCRLTATAAEFGIGLAALSALWVCASCLPRSPEVGPSQVHRIEQIEEQTESFANDLLELSLAVRAGDVDAIGSHFAEQVFGIPFPQEAGDLYREVKWIRRCNWPVAASPRTYSRRAFVGSLIAFLEHLDTVEDARFKVKKSSIGPQDGTIDGRIGLWLVARDRQGRREWIRGRATVFARRQKDGRWQMERFSIEHLESMICDRDLFDEVSDPAGVGASAPLFLERTDPRFAAYGVAAADLNGDDLVDIVVAKADGLFVYVNQGDGTFRDVAQAAFVKHLPGTGTMPLLLDFDNDGDRDIFVSTIGEQVLLENRLVPDGHLSFWDVSMTAGVARGAVGFSAAAGDINRDGYPDIYVASYNRYGEILPDRWDGATNGTPNLLFVSRGDGTYREEAAAWGVADGRWSYAAQFADVDADGDLDLYVANDFGGGNALYLNEGTRFRDVAVERGVADWGYGMGVSFGDYDNDGDLDLHVTRMSSTAGGRILARMSARDLPQKSKLENLAAGNSLYENVGDGFFRDVTEASGPFSGGWAWGGGFFDLDNDGWQDLYTPNGFISGKTFKDT